MLAMNKNTKKRIFLVLRIIFGFGVLILLFFKVGFSDIITTFSNLNLSVLAVILLLYPFSFIISTINLKLLSRLPNRKVSFKILLKYMVLSWSYSLFLPGKVGEFSLIYFMKQSGYKIGEASALTLMDKLISILMLLILSSYGLIIFFGMTLALIILSSILVLLIFGMALLLSTFGRRIGKKILRKYATIFKGFSVTLFFYFRKAKLMLLLNFLFTFLKWMLISSLFFLIFRSYDFNVSAFVVISVTAATVIVALIPISLSGLGIKESFAVFAYSHIGADPAIILTTYLLFTILTYLTEQ